MLIADIAAPLVEANKEPVTFSWGRLFVDSYNEMKETYPDLDKKYNAFVSTKSSSITNRYSTHDYAFVGALSDFRHCHLAMDVILIYRIQRSNIEMLYVCKHDEILKTRNKEALIRRLR